MNHPVLNIPDDSRELAPWLEQALAGGSLRALVTGLLAFNQSDRGQSPELRAILGDATGEVLERGLAGAPEECLRALLRHPERLLELQELVLSEGGEYWAGRLRENKELTTASQNLGQKLANLLAKPQPVRVHAKPSATPSRRLAWRMPLAVAAAVLISAVSTWEVARRRFAPAPTVLAGAWCWPDPDASAAETRETYFEELAAGGRKWFDKRPDTAATVAARINEYRQGCTRLLLAKHTPLGDDDRAWLRERCRNWSDKLDAQLQALEGGAAPLAVRGEVDKIAENLDMALRERAGATTG